MKRAIAQIGLTATVIAATSVGFASSASAAEACTNLSGPAGGRLPLCKTWVWDGNDYDGKWRTNGPSTLPSYSYLERWEDGSVYRSAYSGSYYDRDKVYFRVCDSRAGRCGSWW
ncbi:MULTISPECIES: hypothetical protein [unclassified Streptomyces]|uniref:hypothetical protein n=1 Tax=Streptomyces TaxID=1883 RepID=UPI0013687A28|nr:MULTISPECIES: hypothetical protein [unclassified Streptomyces]NEA03633.1 hypothetical protein [Streptomyces sp. SID10116]MYY84879.1 hypothetical protein [Streptomyces sp. SID335]MYZ14503.1 hypothetical protein [Streptomyces sp. SID337]NDZ92048.1 hypothetical protein [Streptomyces sp. SID10115]NEB50364.1 hypothetical protein [Streptomyces sp. SID339]